MASRPVGEEWDAERAVSEEQAAGLVGGRFAALAGAPVRAAAGLGEFPRALRDPSLVPEAGKLRPGRRRPRDHGPRPAVLLCVILAGYAASTGRERLLAEALAGIGRAVE